MAVEAMAIVFRRDSGVPWMSGDFWRRPAPATGRTTIGERSWLLRIGRVRAARHLDRAVVDRRAVEQDAEGGHLDVDPGYAHASPKAPLVTTWEQREVDAPDRDGPEVVEDGVPDAVEHVRH